MTDGRRTPMAGAIRDEYRVSTGGEPLQLHGLATVGELADKADAKDELDGELRPRLFDLHELMMANEDYGLLLVLQGLDASGKSGTIKHVVSAMNPVGVRVSAFREPTEEERREHFLERIRRAVPDRGQLGVFDRSHYEDAVVPDVEDDVSEAELDVRLGEIVEFERELGERGITVVKCFLHISYDEQRDRFLRRLRRPDKHWKFDESDVETRAKWIEHQAAFGRALGLTSTDVAPWYVIPADKKWHRNWAIARLLIEHFEVLEEQYPPLAVDADAMRARLEAPG